MTHRYHGSCHCGAVTFAAELDLAAGGGRCNCSICTKTRAWSVIARPDALHLLTGEAVLSDYQFGTASLHHLFCRHCGVRPFARGHLEVLGGDFVSINLACLDDVPDEVLAGMPIRYANGRDNDWMHSPAVTRHL